MKVFVYWENEDEQADAESMISPIAGLMYRHAFGSTIVQARSYAEGLAAEAAKFDQDVENAFRRPVPTPGSHYLHVGPGIHREVTLPDGAVCQLDPPLTMSMAGTILVTVPEQP